MLIEVGKKYINAEGDIIYIIGIDCNYSDYKFIDEDGCHYLETGRFDKHNEETFDLICLVDENLLKQYEASQIRKKEFISKHIELYTGEKL